LPYEQIAENFRPRLRQSFGKSRLLSQTTRRKPHDSRRDDPFCQTVVPDHKELDRGTLRAIIRQAGLSVDEFINLGTTIK